MEMDGKMVAKIILLLSLSVTCNSQFFNFPTIFPAFLTVTVTTNPTTTTTLTCYTTSAAFASPITTCANMRSVEEGESRQSRSAKLFAVQENYYDPL